MHKSHTAIGFYQEKAAVKQIIAKLKKNNFSGFATICRSQHQNFKIKHYFNFYFFLSVLLAFVLILALTFFKLSFPLATLLAVITAVTLTYTLKQLFEIVPESVINHYKKSLIIGETLILVQVDPSNFREVLSILRSASSDDGVTFLLREPLKEYENREIPKVPISNEALAEEALKLASSTHNISKVPSFSSFLTFEKTLMNDFKESKKNLHALQNDVTSAEYIEQKMPSSAEWLLDNMHILEASIEEVFLNLPKKFYCQLPKIAAGSFADLPRIYILAIELVKFTLGDLRRENIILFLKSYQQQTHLTIGELWAFPLMLRLRLIEWVESLGIRLDNRMREGELASFFGNRFLNASIKDRDRVSVLLTELFDRKDSITPHFAEELLDHLFDEETLLPQVKKVLGEILSPDSQTSLQEILRQEHLEETLEQLVFSNAIKSLMNLSQLSWPAIFEEVSPVDALLREDSIYPLMDFATRDAYRQSIESMAKASDKGELEVTKNALSFSQEGKLEFEKHVGFYLIDEGRTKLEETLHVKIKLLEKIRRFIKTHASAVYPTFIFMTLLVFEALPFYYLFQKNSSLSTYLLFFFLSFLPLLQLAIQSVNLFLNMILPASQPPQMAFEKGIPKENKTLVVVPMILFNEVLIQDELNKLEIRYLANKDPAISFSLFSDFKDSIEEVCKGDAALIKTAVDGIQALNIKYGEGRFFLFHRKRIWSKGENRWIGWERKRGKLETLNRFLEGESLPENILYVGKQEQLKNVRYVITLDADTELPKEQARALIEVLSHPLNRPVMNEEKTQLRRGYTIIQPRVGTNFIEAKASLFCKIFSEPTVLDPYSKAVSNVYQDLFSEGSYHGKGIYDLKTFHKLLDGRFPENRLLSHDLIEGAFTRVLFASSICLFDIHPKDFFSFSKRQWRWIRGDWQIIDWLFPSVPTGNLKREKNSLSFINRWKIFDNLQRSILPINLLLLVICGFFFPNLSTIFISLALVVLLFPTLALCMAKIRSYSFSPIKPFLKELKILLSRYLITIALLPFEALLSLDAILRTAFRRLISKKNLLQWTTGEYACKNSDQHQKFVYRLTSISFFSLLILVSLITLEPSSLWIALPFCLLFVITPLLVSFIDQPSKDSASFNFSSEERDFLRKIGRKTWRYYDDLVTRKGHFLPPDNYQVYLNKEVANRTSPTNIGFWLLALLNSYDFNYITEDELIDKALGTLQELQKLERYEGNFLNWYAIESMEPLYPRYVSTVDSGNLLASLWTFREGLSEIVTRPLIGKEALQGIKDSYEVYKESTDFIKIVGIENIIYSSSSNDLLKFSEKITEGLKIFASLQEGSKNYWIQKIESQFKELESIVYRYFNWVEVLNSVPTEFYYRIDQEALNWRDEALFWELSLETLADKKHIKPLQKLIDCSREKEDEIKNFGKKLEEAVLRAKWFAGEKLGAVAEIQNGIDRLSDEMNFKFLYSLDRKLFSIGYNVDEQKLDGSYYDLLASEARIASFVAIAKEDAPLEHWWALGRLYRMVYGRKVLLSWGGTMFEYLMPLLFHKQYTDSLMGDGCDGAVFCQMNYGKKRKIPWGISESAYSALDAYKIYQYKSFGVPGLALKRGLEDDLVVSPYSTFLALAVAPQAALNNLRKMAKNKNLKLSGDYGYYESIDFGRQHNQEGDLGVIIYAYMAHHQGMIFSSLNNCLNGDPLIKRFHKDPRVAGVSSLLYEKIPYSSETKVINSRKERNLKRLDAFSENPIFLSNNQKESLRPKINLLSNGKYSLMITKTGGGYSRFNDIELYRWRADTTKDSFGSFCYVKEMQNGQIWSTTYQPMGSYGKEYFVTFKGDRTEFRRRDEEIETVTEVVVSPEDNVEIRLITLHNYSKKMREIELTSYLELALAPHLTDLSHPAFNKLFIETTKTDSQALLANRRVRSPEEKELYALHLLSSSQPLLEECQYETDRLKFIGRGRTLKNPLALEEDLSKTTGTVLDPIFSLRGRILVYPGKSVQVAFVTGIAESREGALALIEKYEDFTASSRTFELAWNYSQLELRYLRIQQEEAALFQKLGSRLIYPHKEFRVQEERLFKNQLGQAGLWSQGISGDLPIIVVTIGDVYDVDLVKQLLIAHQFLRLRGLKSDLVIINEEDVGYFQILQEQLQNLVNSNSYPNETGPQGAVFLRNRDLLDPPVLDLILSSAHVHFAASRGLLRQQLFSPKPCNSYPRELEIEKEIQEEPSKPLSFLELPYFNGLGGYTNDGRCYVIYLDSLKATPAPWINVIANENFGTLVSEVGLGTTWYGNSQTNRLTPWSNDAVLNPITDTLYIRDEKMGVFWTPTPSPIRELDPYRISHGAGFSRFEHSSHAISQELIIFVPMDNEGGSSLRIQRLRLKNDSHKKRYLSVTGYSEWVLGNNRESMQMHVITEWDDASSALFAFNHYQNNFSECVAFSFTLDTVSSYTADRTEFIGRNQSERSPAALTREGLSGMTGVALDPCAAIQTTFELDQEEEKEITFIIGYAKSVESARDLISKCREKGEIERLYSESSNWWEKALGTVEVTVPDIATNFLMNRWFLYQTISCRFFARTAFYQSSGAFGFRDQLQDSMAFLYSVPKLSRDHILKSASRQFIEGDVQHWWHPESGLGVRTTCSDDFLWLVYVTLQYVKITADFTILEEEIFFLEGTQLGEGQHELLETPKVSSESGTLLEHCKRAIRRGMTSGPHGLPLIGSGDWNDGMNLVGVKGKGESVFVGWFFIQILNDFATLLKSMNRDEALREELLEKGEQLVKAIEENCWDGNWYLRAFFDDGTPIGSKKSEEAFIDSLPQSWAVMCGKGDRERIKQALTSVEKYLVKKEIPLVLLLTPPFNKMIPNPGYIQGYPKGVRENGGQYTHAAAWLSLAYVRCGEVEKAIEILKMIAPTAHTETKEAFELYKLEPYVVAADIYDLEGQVGRGGWSWYTGSVSWIYRVWLEEVLGFKLRGSVLSIGGQLPAGWEQFEIKYRYERSLYRVFVKRGEEKKVLLDGQLVEGGEILLVDDEREHLLEVFIN